MGLEEQLAGWTAPSSTTEQEKQERTERMIREAIASHDALAGCSLSVYAKGSYPNNTNVRSDSDVDVAVQCSEAESGSAREQTPAVTHKRIRAVIAVAAAVWAVMLVLQGVNVGASLFKPLSGVIGVTVLFLGFYDRRMWRWRGLRRLQKQPILHGTWKGTLQTTWVDPATGSATGPIEVYLAVRQTASTVAFDVLTVESSSSTTSAALDAAESGAWILSGSYLNRPRMLIQHRSRVHRGSAVLEVHPGGSTLIEGAYWTDRDTKGSLRFTEHVLKTVTHFEHAAVLFNV